MSEQSASRGNGSADGPTRLYSVGPITFGHDGVLFLADNVQARILAVDLRSDVSEAGVADIENLDSRLATYLGCGTDHIRIRDLAVHPLSHALYLTVVREAGGEPTPILLRIAGSEFAVVDVASQETAWVSIDDAPSADDERVDMRAVVDGDTEGAPFDIPQLNRTVWVARDQLRSTTVTDLAYVNGELLVAGASNEEFVSTLRRIRVPFGSDATTTSLEIFHVSHGKYETHSPIRTFIPYAGGTSVLASYTCTPIVRFPLADLVGGTRVVGRTVADLGMLSTPVDMVSFESAGGEEFVLVSNTRRPLMKIASHDIDAQEPLTEPKEPIGVPREELPHQNVGRMVVVDETVLMMQRDDDGLHLRGYSTASL
jgi:hypothetical protein